MSLLSILSTAQPPSVAVEIAANRVSAANIELRGGKAVVSAQAVEPLPDHALVPSMTGTNALDRATVIGALGRVLDRIGGRPRRAGLVVPDQIAKVSLVRFEQVPAREQELDQLVRWQVRKAAPFPIEAAQVSYVPGAPVAGGREFIVVMARRDIVEEYEGLLAEVGPHVGLVDLATFNVANAVLAASPHAPEDWLLVNVSADSASIAILRGGHLIFFRNLALDAEGTLADLVHQSAMYYEDRLDGGGFGRVILAGGTSGHARQAAEVEQARRSLADRLGRSVETIDPLAVATLTDRITASPALVDALAPLIGLVLRGREVEAS